MRSAVHTALCWLGLAIPLLFCACHGQQHRQMLALLDEADSLNRAYAQLPSDTLLLEAAAYFDRHGSSNERLRAHYLLGCAYRDMGDAPRALQCYLDAVDRADTLSSNCDLKLLARVHGQAGDLFAAQTLYENAESEYREASRLALKGGDTLTSILAYGQLESCCFGVGDTLGAITVNGKTRKMLYQHGYESLANSFLATSINLLLERKDYDEAARQISKYEYNWQQRGTNAISDPKFKLLLYYKGVLNEGIGRVDSAVSFYYQLAEEGITPNNIGLGYKGLLSAYEKQQKPDSVIKYAKLFTEHLEMMSGTVEQSNLQNLRGLYNYTRHQQIAEREARKSEKLRLDLTIATTALILAFLVAIIVYVNIRHNNEQQRQLLITKNVTALFEYASIKSALDAANKDNEDYKRKYKLLMAEFEKAKNALSELQPDKKTPEEWNIESSLLTIPIVMKLHKQAATASAASQSDLAELRMVAKKLMPGFMTAINSCGYLVDRRETDICIFVKLRFIPSEIGVLLNIRKNNLSNIRKRMLLRMFAKEGSAKNFDEIIQEIPA